jgi:hypothetical protein
MGTNVLWTTGGAQLVSGTKRFATSPLVPYIGDTGAAPSARWVSDQLTSASGQLTTNLVATGSLLYTLLVNASGALTGQGGGAANVGAWQAVYRTGDQSISGTKQFISPVIVPNPTANNEAVNLAYLLAVSGILATQGGGGSPNSVTTTGNEVIGGFKVFTGSPYVPMPTQPSGAANLALLIAMSGALTGLQTGAFVGPSGAPGPVGPTGAPGSGVTNNYYITGTGIVTASSTGLIMSPLERYIPAAVGQSITHLTEPLITTQICQ